MTVSNPTRVGLTQAPLSALGELALRSIGDYRPEAFGDRAARAAVLQHVPAAASHAVALDDVMLTASTSEAYAYLFKLLCNPGDAVLVPAPSYPLFEHLAELEGVRVQSYRLRYDGSWHIDMDSVRRALSAETRAIVLVSPNNPTGNYVTLQELSALSSVGLPLISDEVFADFPLREASSWAISALSQASVLTFVLGGLSKLVGLPQLKLAWTLLGGPEGLRREARERLELISDTYLSVGAAALRLAGPVLAQQSGFREPILARCRTNRERLEALARSSPLDVLSAQGGWSSVLRLPRLQSEDEWVLGLLRESGVVVQPGWFYDFESEPHCVLSLLPEPADFAEGVSRLVAHVKRCS